MVGSALILFMCASGISSELLNAHSLSAPRTCRTRLPPEMEKATMLFSCRVGRRFSPHAHLPDVLSHRSELSVDFLHLIAPYFFSISVVFSIGSASTVCPRPVVVVARKMEL